MENGEIVFVSISERTSESPKSSSDNWQGETYTTEKMKGASEDEINQLWRDLGKMFGDGSGRGGHYKIMDGKVIAESEFDSTDEYISRIHANAPFCGALAKELGEKHLVAAAIYSDPKYANSIHGCGLAKDPKYRGTGEEKGICTMLRLADLFVAQRDGKDYFLAECTGKGSLDIYLKSVSKFFPVKILREISYSFSFESKFTILEIKINQQLTPYTKFIEILKKANHLQFQVAAFKKEGLSLQEGISWTLACLERMFGEVETEHIQDLVDSVSDKEDPGSILSLIQEALSALMIPVPSRPSNMRC